MSWFLCEQLVFPREIRRFQELAFVLAKQLSLRHGPC
jgi:hypothetical protein